MFTTAADNQPAVDIHVLQGEREFVADNRTLGRFQLTGITPAPRGVPQVEVTFDIDANGIISVKATDKGTGKEQEITIRESGSLSEEERDKMVNEAEVHAEEDKKKREKIEAQNEADNIIYTSEKALKDHGDKISDDEKKTIQDALEKLKKVKDTGTPDEMREKISKLGEVSQKLGQAAHQQAAGQEAGEGEQSQEKSKDETGEKGKEGEDVTDADYEVEK